MGPICPECQAGKHTNCDGIGNVSNELMPIACRCENGEHPNRSYFFLEHPPIIMDVDASVEDEPENDPGINADAFSELFDEATDWEAPFRVRPEASVIEDLFDVQVQNPDGNWVPAVPMPIFLRPFWLKRVQCHCGRKLWNRQRYQEHYAYAHILGMGN